MALILATWNRNIELVNLLLVNGASVNEKDSIGATALSEASLNGKTKIAKLLLEKGANVNSEDKDGWTPLHFASAAGHLDMVKLLIANGANVSAKANNPLNPKEFPPDVTSVKLASNFFHEEIVKEFFKNDSKNESMEIGT